MRRDVETLGIVCQHYRRHYAQGELRRVKNVVRRLRGELTRLNCELYILQLLVRLWVRSRGVDDDAYAYRNIRIGRPAGRRLGRYWGRPEAGG